MWFFYSNISCKAAYLQWEATTTAYVETNVYAAPLTQTII